MKSLSFESGWTDTLSLNPIVPLACRTPVFTATSNQEVALIAMDSTYVTTADSQNSFFLAVAASVNGGAFSFVSTQYSIAQIGLATSVSTRARMPLVAGRTYVFGTVVVSNGSPANAGASCHGLVIVSTEQ